jgi:hypothetical protein
VSFAVMDADIPHRLGNAFLDGWVNPIDIDRLATIALPISLQSALHAANGHPVVNAVSLQ